MSAEHEWLNLLEVSGPFLAIPVLREAFPQGLEELEASRAKRLRSAYEEWRDAVDADDADVDRLHAAWIDEALRTALEVDDSVLRSGDRMPATSIVELPEHDTSITPNLVLVDPTHGDALLSAVHIFPPDTDLSASMKFGGLACSPGDRMALYLRAIGKPFGLVTNGERWMLVHAPAGQVATFASWYARLWGQEPQTLRAFASLLSIRRFFAPEQDKLPALFERSLKHQDEVTDALGDQVRRAIEVLVQALDRADQDRNRELLRDVRPQELYEAGLTVMMRLVFLLAAEERGLLLLGEPRYDSFYAVSTLRMQLRAETDEILERRRAAWSRLLAVSRAVYGGIDHPTLHLPAMGGSLFDPDRFPFLEGRSKGTSWRQHRAEPLPIDDRTILLLLEAIQTFEGRTLSYRALDVEQIGHVYEGLLERTVVRVEDVTLELEAGAQARDARVTLGELTSARLDGQTSVLSLLVERSKRSESAIRNALAAEAQPQQGARLLSACRGDVVLRDRLEPYVHLLRTDPWGYPLVHPKGAFVVVLGADRRETGTHYTPKSLTERIVEETLTPLVYDGPAKGWPRGEWKLKTPEQLLDLKVCDLAMGSGAFLVQACRFLGARLVEAWAVEEAAGRLVDLTGQVHEFTSGVELMPTDAEVRAEYARRIVVELCIYGVDLNPLAVELAKLSLWLVTLSKGRPFGFLDHNLKAGDSLLGVHRLDQLIELSPRSGKVRQGMLFGKAIEAAVAEAVELRLRLREMPIRDIRDVSDMANVETEARARLVGTELFADAFIGIVFAAAGEILNGRLASLSTQADQILAGDHRVHLALSAQAERDLNLDRPRENRRRPFHWPLAFPEVFLRPGGGFDAVLGNPPFLGGRKIRGALGGAYLRYLTSYFGENSSGNADLCSFFFLRAHQLCSKNGACGFVATNSIAEGDTRKTGLEYLVREGARIYHAEDDFPWPGTASVTVALVVFSKVESRIPPVLGRTPVDKITAALKTEEIAEKAHPLTGNKDLCFQGSVLAAKGFILTREQAEVFLKIDARNADVVMPYFTGDEVFNDPVLTVSRFVINFHDWPMEKAKRYEAPFRIVEERVRPVRALVNRKAHREYWWHFGDKRPALYLRLRNLNRCLVQTRHTKYLCPQFVRTGVVFSESVVVFPADVYWLFGLLNSQIHEVWARETSGSIGTGLRYTPTDCLLTFPLPERSRLVPTAEIAAELDRKRSAFRTSQGMSVNQMMDAIHDPSRSTEDLDELRQLQLSLDAAVVEAYGWGDLRLDHDFRDVPSLPPGDCVRFMFSEKVRTEVLRRLLSLNLSLCETASPRGRRASARMTES